MTPRVGDCRASGKLCFYDLVPVSRQVFRLFQGKQRRGKERVGSGRWFRFPRERDRCCATYHSAASDKARLSINGVDTHGVGKALSLFICEIILASLEPGQTAMVEVVGIRGDPLQRRRNDGVFQKRSSEASVSQPTKQAQTPDIWSPDLGREALRHIYHR